MNDMELKAIGLTKDYAGKLALNQVSFALTPGIYGLLGPNGAGKSTLIKILTRNIPQSAGILELDGKNVRHMEHVYIKKLGYVPQQQGLYPELSAEQFLYYMARLKDIKNQTAREQIEYLLKKVNLYEVRHKKLGGYSGGMKQRVMIAQALLGDPAIVILDEPTAGLDPKERIRLRNLISELAFDKIVLIATHVVTDIEFISKEVLILSEGRLIRKGTPDVLLEELQKKVWEVGMPQSEYPQRVKELRICNVSRRAEQVFVRLLGTEEQIRELACPHMQPIQPDLQDLYYYLFSEEVTGHGGE